MSELSLLIVAAPLTPPTEPQLKTLEERYVLVLAELAKWKDAEDPNPSQDIAEVFNNALRWSGLDELWDSCMELDDLVFGVKEVWRRCYSDVDTTDFPSLGVKVIAAGASTDGYAPEGEGYKVLTTLSTFDLLPLLGWA